MVPTKNLLRSSFHGRHHGAIETENSVWRNTRQEYVQDSVKTAPLKLMISAEMEERDVESPT